MKYAPSLTSMLVTLAASGLVLADVSPVAAESTCPADIVSPADGATTSVTPTIEVEPDTGGCDPNWKVLELRVTHTGSGNVVYSYERDRGASRAYSSVSPPFSHTVPNGELQQGQRYRISANLHIPKPFQFDTNVGVWPHVRITTRGPQQQGQQSGNRGRQSGNYVSVEPNTDRPGSDYRDFDLASADPDRCADACEDDGRCEAYTYVPPGVQAASARCWLKDSVPSAQSAQGMVSGVKGSPLPQNVDVDRPGSDYRDFNLAAAEPSRCAEACAGDNRCRAYTYVPPGRQAASARCWLKDAVPRATSDEGLVSGTK